MHVRIMIDQRDEIAIVDGEINEAEQRAAAALETRNGGRKMARKRQLATAVHLIF